MDLNLRPISYDELCQMELLHMTNAGQTNMTPPTAPPNNITNNSGLLPIMVIPTSMMAAGAVLTTTNTPENYYQLLTATQAANTVPQAFLLTSAATTTATATATTPATANANATSIATDVTPQTTGNSLKHKLFDNVSTLPIRLQTDKMHNKQMPIENMEESDFDGSECGASISTRTCIPHFRFGGCGMMLQPMSISTPPPPPPSQPSVSSSAAPSSTTNQQQQQQQQQHGEQTASQESSQIVGCGSLSHMMGSFAAAAAGSALHSGRIVGTLVGVGAAGLTSTLGRNRRNAQDGTTQKRVSFKTDFLPAEQLVDYSHNGGNENTNANRNTTDNNIGRIGMGMGMNMNMNMGMCIGIGVNKHWPNSQSDAFNNCSSHMHFDSFIDYQVGISLFRFIKSSYFI